MYEIKYIRKDGTRVQVLVGALEREQAKTIARNSDSAWKDLLHCRNCVGEVWFISSVPK